MSIWTWTTTPASWGCATPRTLLAKKPAVWEATSRRNAGGPHCLAYGTTTNHVLGMEVVLEDGSVVSLGGLAREVPGYDLRGVFVGSEGTFGVATKIMVRLLPLPERVKTFLGIFPDIDSACSAVSAVIGHGIVPAALEMIDRAEHSRSAECH